MFLAQGMEVAAGVNRQVIGLPQGRDSRARQVSAFVEDMKASGFVASALQRHNIESALVAPPGC